MSQSEKKIAVGVFEFADPEAVAAKWREMSSTPEARLKWYLELIAKTPMKYVYCN
jgi:hypothetical protein